MEIQGGGLGPDAGAVLQLNTVRALHQTVVSLRAALEASKSELDDLRQKYESHTDSSAYSDTIKKLTLENSILKKKLTGSDAEEDLFKGESEDFAKSDVKTVTFNLESNSEIDDSLQLNSEDLTLESGAKNTSDDNENLNPELSVSDLNSFDVAKSTDDKNDRNLVHPDETAHCNDSEPSSSKATPKENHNDTIKKVRISNEHIFHVDKSDCGETHDEQIGNTYETKIELESKFDVTIKVSATKASDTSKPLEVKAVDCSSISVKTENRNNAQSKSSEEDTIRLPQTIDSSDSVQIGSSDEVNMAGSREISLVNKSDKFNIQVKITSEENLVMDQCSERESASEHLNIEPDEISARSISEGDNSVFSEAAGTITGGGTGGGGRRICEQDSISGNDSEEVDDIELIFTTDETKEFTGYQEDLVSITDAENWARGDTSTPVLLKFNLLENDSQVQKTQNSITNVETTDNFENENQENTSLQSALANTTLKDDTTEDRPSASEKDESLDKIGTNQIMHRRGYLRSVSSNTYVVSDASQQDSKNFESNDSFFENQKSFSFDNTKSSSLDRGSSTDVVTRDLSFDQKEESLDQLDALRTTMRTKYSVYVETDISKCGVMEEDSFPGNLNLRRNTCPNPFQYKPLSHRDAVKGSPARPLLTPSSQRGPRRSSAAQTDISALPNHWRSDTHLAKKAFPSALTTLPSKVSKRGTNMACLIPIAPVRTSHRTEESRRVLLSDIGFTSMVPELSRSAEPIWGALGASMMTPSTSVSRLPLCCAFHATPCYGSVPSSPTRQDSSNTNSKYWSKSSIQRSISGRMGETTPGSHRVSFIDQPMRSGWRGSLPELRKNMTCCAGTGHRFHKMSHFSNASRSKTIEGPDSGDSTEELLDEAERFLRSSIDCVTSSKAFQDDYYPSRYSRPYLPTVPRQLRLGHLVKIIAPHGRIALGKVRYVGIAGGPAAPGTSASTYVGVQLKTRSGMGGDGSFHGRRYFHCEPGCSVFVPFSKVVVAWADA